MSSITVHMSAGAAFDGRKPASRSAQAAPIARSRLRLTPRGRLVLIAVASAPLLAAALWFGVSGGAASAQAPSSAAGIEHGRVGHVTVAQGQSLWQIAEKVAPHDDPRDVIDAIVDMNGLQSTVVTPGESLAIPAQYAK